MITNWNEAIDLHHRALSILEMVLRSRQPSDSHDVSVARISRICAGDLRLEAAAISLFVYTTIEARLSAA